MLRGGQRQNWSARTRPHLGAVLVVWDVDPVIPWGTQPHPTQLRSQAPKACSPQAMPSQALHPHGSLQAWPGLEDAGPSICKHIPELLPRTPRTSKGPGSSRRSMAIPLTRSQQQATQLMAPREVLGTGAGAENTVPGYELSSVLNLQRPN